MVFHDALKNKNIYSGDKSSITGDGWLEEQAIINGKIESRFFVGAYSILSDNSLCKNSFIGRFTHIDENVHIGYARIDRNIFSNHPFSKGLTITGEDEYYKSIKTRYFYEQNKYTFIGSDVFIGRNSIIEEGCVIGDGALIEPNCYVNFDVPNYAIVSGLPSRIIGYRFDEEIVVKLMVIKWWTKNISSLHGSNKPNIVDHVNNLSMIDDLCNLSLPPLEKKRYHLNTHTGTIELNTSKNMITGPSHVDLWYNKYLKGQVSIPLGYHLLPIPALSLFSNQLDNLIDWWSKWFDHIILFVPDFRIGNVSVDKKIKDGRFIKQSLFSSQNSMKCFELGIEQLDKFEEKGNIKFWFWCLYGREEINKSKNNYKDPTGNYKHPLWNYQEISTKYKNSTIDISTYFPKILENIVDESIHPNKECYERMSEIFSSL